jgi:tetratricopeptide (TPR) repeat protein
VRLPTEQLLRVIRDAAAALHKAHLAGLVHRDFKPANILLDTQGRAYLSDFGIARDLEGRVDATLSLDGMIVGTPALMSPEQARGEGHAIDARADIYALGATLFVLLCGRYPFEGRSTVDVLHAVIHDDPPLPRSLNPSIPRPIEAIILKCMHKDRRLRYQSTAELVQNFDDFLGGREVEGEQAAWFRRLVGAGPARPVSEPDLFETLGVEALQEIAAWDADLYRVSRQITRLHLRLDLLIKRLSDVLLEFPHFSWARFYRGMAFSRRGHLEQALDDMERSIDRMGSRCGAQFEMGRLYLDLHLREQRLAYRHMSPMGTHEHLSGSRGRLHQAVVAFEEARRLSSDLPGWQLEFAQAVGRLAEQDHAGCVAVCDRILADDPDVGEAWRLRGDALRLAGQDPCASYDEALRVRRSDYQACMNKGEALLVQGRIGDARECLDRALEIYPDCIEALVQLARAYLAECRMEAGLPEPAAGAAALAEGVRIAERARELDPRSYEAAVTIVELHLEQARRGLDPRGIERALATLQEARELPGCQNRVNYLLARSHLEAARSLARAGGDPDPDLQRALALGHDILQHIPDDPTWLGLVSEVQRVKSAESESESNAFD